VLTSGPSLKQQARRREARAGTSDIWIEGDQLHSYMLQLYTSSSSFTISLFHTNVCNRSCADMSHISNFGLFSSWKAKLLCFVLREISFYFLLPSHWKCGRLCFDRRVIIYLYACYSHNKKSFKPNRMKFGGMIGYYPGTIWLDFGINRVKVKDRSKSSFYHSTVNLYPIGMQLMPKCS